MDDVYLRVDLGLIAIQMVILVPTVIAVCCLWGYQMQLIISNTTSIEAFSKESLERKARRWGQVIGEFVFF
jgi:hypothetical protein